MHVEKGTGGTAAIASRRHLTLEKQLGSRLIAEEKAAEKTCKKGRPLVHASFHRKASPGHEGATLSVPKTSRKDERPRGGIFPLVLYKTKEGKRHRTGSRFMNSSWGK